MHLGEGKPQADQDPTAMWEEHRGQTETSRSIYGRSQFVENSLYTWLSSKMQSMQETSPAMRTAGVDAKDAVDPL